MRRTAPARTAKSCGPDTPSLVSRLAGNIPQDSGGYMPGHRGEHEAAVKTIAQGRPDCLRWTCMLVCVFLCTFAHETAGAVRIRLSLHPLLDLEGGNRPQSSGASRRENADAYLLFDS